MDVAVGVDRLAGIDGVLVVWRRIEFLNHVGLQSRQITPLISRSSICPLGRAGTGVYQKTTTCRWHHGNDA